MKKTDRQPPCPSPGAELLKAGSSLLQPDVWMLRDAAPPAVWKTFRARPRWLRSTVGAFITRREARNLATLEGLTGVPTLLGLPEPWTLSMTLLDASPLPEVKRGHGLDPSFFRDLEDLIAEIHARGLNHGDLRRRNLMRREDDGAPALVDFAQSFTSDTVLGRFGMRAARKVDRMEFLKLKRWYLGKEKMTAEELSELADVPGHLRLGRFLRKRMYRPIKRTLRRKAK